MTHMTFDQEDQADKLDGDLSMPPTVPRHRRNRSSVGRSATMTLRRKVDFVANSITKGRPDSATTKACLSGADADAVRHGVWKRAHHNATLALALTDEFKRRAAAYARTL